MSSRKVAAAVCLFAALGGTDGKLLRKQQPWVAPAQPSIADVAAQVHPAAQAVPVAQQPVPAWAQPAKPAAPAAPAALAKTKQEPAAPAASGFNSFEEFYAQYQTGRGIWKWNNALIAYSRHMMKYKGQPVKLAEVGVQSGGSVTMWHQVLGDQCRVYGMDINPKTMKFGDAMTTIIMGDQGDVNVWNHFFTTTMQNQKLDVLIDDGGHMPNQMLTTLTSAYPYIAPGGLISIEDIHGEHYVESFLSPAAYELAKFHAFGNDFAMESVHIYPFVLVVQKAGGNQVPLTFKGEPKVVHEFAEIWAEVPNNKGGHIVLENEGWGPFFTGIGISNFMKEFSGLFAAEWQDMPDGCEHTNAAVCTVLESNSLMQALITGVHIYPTRVVVEVAEGPVRIEAVRHGTDWLQYGF